MPWKKEPPVSDQRLCFVQSVLINKLSVAQACRDYGLSRKTGYKWLRRHKDQPGAALADHSRKPHSSPHRTQTRIEAAALKIRAEHSWGPAKIHTILGQRFKEVPCVRTLANILARNGCIEPRLPKLLPLSFERPCPNDLWQCDFKGPTEVRRKHVHPFTVLDDYSRFLLQARAVRNLTMHLAFEALWEAFQNYGLPRQILCDRAFGGTTNIELNSISWFESRLIRLGIECIHGRPRHPQTQGKIERFHRTLKHDLWGRIRRDSLEHFNADLDCYRLHVYNSQRPHQALGMQTPLSRYKPSVRQCPRKLPELEYPAGSILKQVNQTGEVRWNGHRILVGRGVAGDLTRIEEREHEVAVFYAQKEVRCVAFSELKGNKFC